MDIDSKIFIAGHNGLVGSAIKRELEKLGFTNLICKNRSQLDLKDSSQVESFFKNKDIEYVFLAAAKVGGILANNTYRADFLYENLLIQNNIIFNAYKYGVKKLLFLGSSCIYPKNAKQPISENELLTSELEYTNEPYAIAKIAGIKLCESFNIQYGTNFLSIMPTNLYGENDNFNLYNSHVLPALIRKMHLAKLLSEGKMDEVIKDLSWDNDIDSKIKSVENILEDLKISSKNVGIWGSGEPRREFLHSSDMARASIFIMQNVNFKDVSKTENSTKEIRNTHINVGSGSDISIKDLAMLVREIVGFKGELVFDKTKPDGTIRKLMDSSKLNNLGFKSEITLEHGIKEVYKNYKNKFNL